MKEYKVGDFLFLSEEGIEYRKWLVDSLSGFNGVGDTDYGRLFTIKEITPSMIYVIDEKRVVVKADLSHYRKATDGEVLQYRLKKMFGNQSNSCMG